MLEVCSTTVSYTHLSTKNVTKKSVIALFLGLAIFFTTSTKKYYNFSPQFPQNFIPGLLSKPHEGHLELLSDFPHSPQNFIPSGTSFPQCGQITVAARLFPQLPQNFRVRLFWAPHFEQVICASPGLVFIFWPIPANTLPNCPAAPRPLSLIHICQRNMIQYTVLFW